MRKTTQTMIPITDPINRFSVLMSIYMNEKAPYLASCLESLCAQTIPANEIVIVEDGPIREDLSKVIDSFMDRLPIRRHKLARNMGLGMALREGLCIVSHELVARMDSDDIAVPERFEAQLAAFASDPELAKNTFDIGTGDMAMSRSASSIPGVWLLKRNMW